MDPTSAPNIDELFKGRHLDLEIIVICVRWYLRYKLSFRDLVEMMAERGLSLAHTTIMRGVRHYVPEFEKRWNRFARPNGRPIPWTLSEWKDSFWLFGSHISHLIPIPDQIDLVMYGNPVMDLTTFGLRSM
jgi:hypothetical protein